MWRVVRWGDGWGCRTEPYRECFAELSGPVRWRSSDVFGVWLAVVDLSGKGGLCYRRKVWTLGRGEGNLSIIERGRREVK